MEIDFPMIPAPIGRVHLDAGIKWQFGPNRFHNWILTHGLPFFCLFRRELGGHCAPMSTPQELSRSRFKATPALSGS